MSNPDISCDPSCISGAFIHFLRTILIMNYKRKTNWGEKLKQGTAMLTPEQRAQSQRRMVERELRIPAALLESAQNNTSYYAKERQLEKENLTRIAYEEEAKFEKLVATRVTADVTKHAKMIKTLKFVHSAVSDDKLTTHAAERMIERNIAVRDILEGGEATVIIKRKEGQSTAQVVTTYWPNSKLPCEAGVEDSEQSSL